MNVLTQEDINRLREEIAAIVPVQSWALMLLDEQEVATPVYTITKNMSRDDFLELCLGHLHRDVSDDLETKLRETFNRHAPETQTQNENQTEDPTSPDGPQSAAA